MTTPDFHSLTGAYALDALDPAEREQFEAHLPDCDECPPEVAEFQATAARLALAVAETPPEALRQRVLAAITAVRQEPPLVAGDDNVVSLTERLNRRRWLTWISAAAAIVAIVVAVGVGIDSAHTRSQLSAEQGQLTQLEQRYAPLARLLAAPDVKVTTGVGTAGGTATAIGSRQLGQVVFVASNLPLEPKTRTYQLWLIGKSGATSAGLLIQNADGAVNPVLVGDLGTAADLGVTVEPAGGSKQPTTTPVLLFGLPA